MYIGHISGTASPDVAAAIAALQSAQASINTALAALQGTAPQPPGPLPPPDPMTFVKLVQ